MFGGRMSSFSIVCSLVLFVMAVSLIFVPQGQLVLAVLVSLSAIVVLFVKRIDIAFSITIVLWMTLTALPLGIASPFDAGQTADLPLYEVSTPLLGLCLLVRIARREERLSNSPLKIPIFVWFSFIVLTYFRNPVFLGDLLGEGGTGVIYHIVYKFFLCAVFYLSAASILNTEKRTVSVAKVMFTVMIVGLLAMTSMVITGSNIPFLSRGIAPWTIMKTIHDGQIVFRVMSMSAYSAHLLLALLCFGSRLSRCSQFLFSLLLFAALVVGGGRTEAAMSLMYFSSSFAIQPRTRWLVATLSLLLLVFLSLVTLCDIGLPHTARRVTDFSRESTTGIGGRLAMAEESSELIMKRPLVGYGYGQVQKYFPSLSQMVASGNPHSGLLSVMTTCGLVGLTIFLWLCLTAIRTAWMLYKNLEDGFLKQLMLWITLHLSASLVTFFVSVELEKSIITYLEMGIVSSVYAVFVSERLPYYRGIANNCSFGRPQILTR